MVIKINEQLKSLGAVSRVGDDCFSDDVGRDILTGKACYAFDDQLNKMWKFLFGDEVLCNIPEAAWSATYNAEDTALMAKIKLRMYSTDLKHHNITSTTIAASLNKSTSAISQIINGKYKASPTKHLHEIWALIEPIQLGRQPAADVVLSKKNIVIRYGDIPFIKTSISNLMSIACNQAKDRRRFSVFAGQAGLGKTISLNEYCKANSEAILLRGSEQTTSKQIIDQLCRALALPKSSSTPKDMEKIIYALQDSERLIILDEADKCKPNALDPLRTISDNARVGVTLVGNNQLVDKLKTQERFELIASRVCFWPKPMGQVSVEDIKTLFVELTQGTLNLQDETDKWWIWLHKRVEGNARELVENLLPHLLKFASGNADAPSKKVDRLLVNSIFSTVLNKPAI